MPGDQELIIYPGKKCPRVQRARLAKWRHTCTRWVPCMPEAHCPKPGHRNRAPTYRVRVISRWNGLLHRKPRVAFFSVRDKEIRS